MTDLAPPESNPLVLLVSDDLLFPSRVREALRPLPYTLRVVATLDALQTALATTPPVAVLVNLTARRYDPLACIALIKDNPETAALPTLAFAGHVEREKHEAARRAGANITAANSSVSGHLPALLTRLLAGGSADAIGETVDDH